MRINAIDVRKILVEKLEQFARICVRDKCPYRRNHEKKGGERDFCPCAFLVRGHCGFLFDERIDRQSRSSHDSSTRANENCGTI